MPSPATSPCKDDDEHDEKHRHLQELHGFPSADVVIAMPAPETDDPEPHECCSGSPWEGD